MSDLHKQNLEEWRRQKGASSSSIQQTLKYRDRAKERRAKYGEEEDTIKPNKLKEKYISAMTEAEGQGLPEKTIGGDNIGNKMLQKMGWKEGLGLGKTNQGRTSIIEVRLSFAFGLRHLN